MTTLAQQRRRPVTLGPKDHGRRMSLAMFDTAIAPNATLYELNKGVIEVSNLPSRIHLLIEEDIQNQFVAYKLARPQIIRYQGGGARSKLLIDAFESERHPDWAVYLTPMPELDQPWSVWQPEIVIEIVSPSSIKRDYEEKPPEYLAIGVKETWILDPIGEQLLVKQNVGGLWRDKVHKPAGKPVTSPLLPGFAFDLKRALAAAK